MSEALAAGAPVPVALSSIVTTLSAPAVSRLTYDHVSALVDEVLVVPDREAVRGVLVVCGGNATTADVLRWATLFGLE